MINIEYLREMNHNYLLLERPEDAQQDEFKRRMFESRKWDRFVHCQEKVVNGKQILYYEINSKVTIENYFVIKKMKISDMLSILRGVEDAWKEASEYLMDEEDIIIDPKYIFLDMDKDEYLFIMHPWKDKDDAEPGERVMPLLNYMLERADEEDGPTNDFIYKICELAGHENFVLSDVLRDAPQGYDDIDGHMVNKEGPNRTSYEDDLVKGLSAVDDSHKSVISGGGEGPCYIAAKRHSHPLLLGGLAISLFLGTAFYIYRSYILTDREKILLSASAASLVFCVAVVLVTYYVRRAKRIKVSDDVAKADNVWYMNDGTGTDTYAGRYEPVSGVSETEPEYGGDDGKTVFLQPVREPGSYKLYASDRKNLHHIELEKLPCVIGKQEGCVDEVIRDGGISRIHARVDHNGECFTVTDLNSTNGTYVNGVRLEPDETMELSDGDEVRFGDLNYCLR